MTSASIINFQQDVKEDFAEPSAKLLPVLVQNANATPFREHFDPRRSFGNSWTPPTSASSARCMPVLRYRFLTLVSPRSEKSSSTVTTKSRCAATSASTQDDGQDGDAAFRHHDGSPHHHTPDRTLTFLLRGFEVPVECQLNGRGGHHRHFIARIPLPRLHRLRGHGFVPVAVSNASLASPSGACLL